MVLVEVFNTNFARVWFYALLVMVFYLLGIIFMFSLGFGRLRQMPSSFCFA